MIVRAFGDASIPINRTLSHASLFYYTISFNQDTFHYLGDRVAGRTNYGFIIIFTLKMLLCVPTNNKHH